MKDKKWVNFKHLILNLISSVSPRIQNFLIFTPHPTLHSYRSASNFPTFASLHAGYMPPTWLVPTPNNTPAMIYKKLDSATSIIIARILTNFSIDELYCPVSLVCHALIMGNQNESLIMLTVEPSQQFIDIIAGF